MANIKLELTEPYNGQFVTFTAPCGCDSVDNGLVINNETYTLVDAKGNTKAGVANTWVSGSKVAVVLDVTNKKAYIQNGIPTASDIGLGNVNNTSDANKPVSTAQATAIADAKKAGTDAQTSIANHIADKNNSHGVTKAQVGLGSVPNVTTNNQTPTYTQATSLATLTSGEKLSVSMGKIMKAITDLISHIDNKNNPHGSTASQVGAVPTGRTVNGKALSSNITLSASDVGALPVDGSGVMTGSLNMRTADSNNNSYIQLADNVLFYTLYGLDWNTRRSLDFYKSGDVAYAFQLSDSINGSVKGYNIFGEHNKPQGDYTGNGSSTQRTIPIGGVSGCLKLIGQDGTNAYFALVFSSGAICSDGSRVYALSKDKLRFHEGNLIINTTDGACNYASQPYWYQAL